MMVETILESSQDFGGTLCAGGGTSPGMPAGALPQWKRELLQRRAARARPAAAAPAPPAPPPPPPPPPPAMPASAPPAPPPRDLDDEELRYGPGIVKRLKSRYLSLALRDAPRRRPSVLRRAASLEHLLDERQHEREPAAPAPPAPAPRATSRPPRPASLAPPAHAPPPVRRDLVKRARSVDALSRLEARDELAAPLGPLPRVPDAPPMPRAARPPRRPAPLLRDAERPPPDVVRAALRKFEPRRAPAPAAPRVAAALRGLDAARTSTPEPRARSPPSPASPVSPGPPADLSAIAELEPEPAPAPAPRVVTRQALEGIARAGCSTRYSFEAARRGSHLPPLAVANPVLVGRARRVGIIRPMPAPALERALAGPMPPPEEVDKPVEEPPPTAADVVDDAPRVASPPPEAEQMTAPRLEKRSPPPSAIVEPTPRAPPGEPAPLAPAPAPRSPPPAPAPAARSPTPEPPCKPALAARPRPLVNGHAEAARLADVRSKLTRIGAAHIERTWNGSADKKCVADNNHVDNSDVNSAGASWSLGAGGAGGSPLGARRAGRAPPAATSVVFNFSARKEVPDYVENDGLILRASRRDRIRAGEPGVVVLRPELEAARGDSGSDDEAGPGEGRAVSPCGVRFVNDNVLINGRSSMPARVDRSRAARLKLQFDDSLTRTFEYPSETSLCEEAPAPAPAAAELLAAAAAQLAEPAHLAPLAANTHISSAALSRYTPSKTCADSFQLGVTRRAPSPPLPPPAAGAPPAPPAPPAHPAVATPPHHECCGGVSEGAEEACGGGGDARPCGADAARSWSDARALATDLLF